MITIVSGTNRVASNSIQVANSYFNTLKEKGLESQVLDLSQLPLTFMSEDMYGLRTNDTKAIIDKYIIPVHHFIFAIPEYNGTYPGALKLFMDAMEPKFFNNKSACLVGLATGRAGNIRGLDAFTHVLHHLQMEVLSNKVLLSQVNLLLDEDGLINDIISKQAIENQINIYKRINNL